MHIIYEIKVAFDSSHGFSIIVFLISAAHVNPILVLIYLSPASDGIKHSILIGSMALNIRY